MNNEPMARKKTGKAAKRKAYKVGGIWVDPMCFPSFERNIDKS
jgi:hypothetical protein